MSESDLHEGDDERLLDTALRIGDGDAVDWAALDVDDPALSETLRELRAIQAMASAELPDEAPAASSVAVAPAAGDGPDVFTWGPLRVRAKLGEGGAGEVWRAFDPALDREVALKLARRGPRVGSGWLDEARRLARVRHPHVLTVYGADVHDGRAGLWMDLVHGRTLEELLHDLGPLSAREAAAVGIDLCAALSAVHAAGLVHGDIKTANVMREGGARDGVSAGRILLMDFGSALASADAPAEPAGGTPLYAAPEVLAGAAPSVASDVYALGAVLFRLVSGRLPVEATTLEQLRERHARGERVALRSLRPDLPAAFVQCVERAVHADPAKRYRSAAEMETALAGVLGVEIAARAGGRYGRGALALAVVAGGLAVAAAGVIATRWAQWTAPRFRVHMDGPSVASVSAARVDGTQVDGNRGAPLAAAGDVNGDGVPDLLVAATGEDGNRGTVSLYYGRRAGPPVLGLTLHGTMPGAGFGAALAGGGDLNGDGYADFAVATNLGLTGENATGSVSVWFGGPGLHETPALVLHAHRAGQDFGYALSESGDMNGDGRADLAIGAPEDDTAGSPTGRAYVYFGGAPMDTVADLDLSSAQSGAQFGISVALADHDGDGFADLIAGANSESVAGAHVGSVYVFDGGRRPDAIADLALHGTIANRWFGYPIATGDFNGDGVADLAVTQMGSGKPHTPAATVHLYFGRAHPTTRADLVLIGPQDAGGFGDALAEVGDVTGDSIADLAVTAPRDAAAGENVGAVYVYAGGQRMDAVADVKLSGTEFQGVFGAAVAKAAPLGGAFGALAIGTPDGSAAARRGGAFEVYQVGRYQMLRPRAGERWRAGGSETVSWLGAEPADIWLSTDGGATFARVLVHAGGAGDNTASVTVPAGAVHDVLVRLTPSAPGVRGHADAGPIPLSP